MSDHYRPWKTVLVQILHGPSWELFVPSVQEKASAIMPSLRIAVFQRSEYSRKHWEWLVIFQRWSISSTLRQYRHSYSQEQPRYYSSARNHSPLYHSPPACLLSSLSIPSLSPSPFREARS